MTAMPDLESSDFEPVRRALAEAMGMKDNNELGIRASIPLMLRIVGDYRDIVMGRKTDRIGPSLEAEMLRQDLIAFARRQTEALETLAAMVKERDAPSSAPPQAAT